METRGGFCKECFHLPHFVDLLSAARKHVQFCPYLLAISTPNNGYCEKAHPHNPRLMIGQHIDLVAGDFNGTAWRCSNRNNISTIEEAVADCALPAPPGLHRCGDLDRSQTTGLTFVGSLNLLNQIGIGKYDVTALSPSHRKLQACARPIKAATTRHGSTLNSSIGAAPNHIMKNMTDEFSSKNVLRHVITGSRKDASVKS